MTKHPPWLVQRIRAGSGLQEVQALMGELGLHTVCESAACPNMGECFGACTATFLILGGMCTRRCRFCAVPKGAPLALDPQEPHKVALAVTKLGLKHAVVTSVTRDDLPDGGAGHFAACIAHIRELSPGTSVEVLVPDFLGKSEAVAIVLVAGPEVFNHNIETVPRLYQTVRPGADYQRSLAVLHQAALAGNMLVKSGIMLGLGETEEEVLAVFADLLAAGVSALTVGQYLRPSAEHLPVVEYIHPDKFRWYEDQAREAGFQRIASGPLVRSSYHAAKMVSDI